MNPFEIIDELFPEGSLRRTIYLKHVSAVRDKALRIAKRIPELKPDVQFLEEASLLHDIGIVFTNAPNLGCEGSEPYIRHGFLGAEFLRQKGFPKHARVAERHTGCGLSKETIKKQHLSLPEQDFLPETIEEKIICFADKFFSKNPALIDQELPLELIKERIAEHDPKDLKLFDGYVKLFKES